MTKSRQIKDRLTAFFIYLCSAFSVCLLVGIICYVFIKGFKTVNWTFLTSVTSVLKGTVGIAGNIVNTLIIIFITMIIATPIGIGSAIFLNEYAKPGKLVTTIEYATETLSGIPSIIFGLFGMMFFGEKLGLGYSILTGSLTLILMWTAKRMWMASLRLFRREWRLRWRMDLRMRRLRSACPRSSPMRRGGVTMGLRGGMWNSVC